MASNTRTTKLMAINAMLSIIGESSTNTITGTLPFEVDLALSILDETIREILQDSYVFNTEYDITVVPSVDSLLIVQDHWVRVTSSNPNDPEEFVIREISVGSNTYCLYSLKDKTKIFISSVDIDIVYLLDWADLPEPAKRYATIRAGRVYADRLVGSTNIRQFTQQDEFEAKAHLLNYETGVDRLNMILDSAETTQALNRSIR